MPERSEGSKGIGFKGNRDRREKGEKPELSTAPRQVLWESDHVEFQAVEPVVNRSLNKFGLALIPAFSRRNRRRSKKTSPGTPENSRRQAGLGI
ncbi:hypothetical protein A6X21_01435 [Planctopirus hydrillae]|uniref:Uncharacterized protein n=1 Tax=Planctopirus hydrillae TaxID=1841610 RepID=A0A1C3E4V9_9PLAN|nr:hypothetical protein A6X21_01435 [Planctopirus hydrillae]